MADKDETIELDDEAIVSIDVTDNPALAQAVTPEPPKEAEPATPATTVAAAASAEPIALAEPDEATKAAAALQEAVTKAQAAEATAQAERRRADEVQRNLDAREAALKEAREQASQRELEIITSGIETATNELTNLEAEFVRAQEAGDFKLAASVQTRVAKAAATLSRLEEAKDSLENRKAEPELPLVQPAASSPLEGYLRNFDPTAQAWLRSHPECVPPEVGGNAQANAKMMAGHYAAVAAGHALNSPAYFQTIEEHTGHRQPVVAPAPASAAAVPAKPVPKAQPSAPVSRDPPMPAGQPVPGRNMMSVTLTPAQQEAALISFPTMTKKEAFAQYARNLMELQAEGKMNRTTH